MLQVKVGTRSQDENKQLPHQACVVTSCTKSTEQPICQSLLPDIPVSRQRTQRKQSKEHTQCYGPSILLVSRSVCECPNAVPGQLLNLCTRAKNTGRLKGAGRSRTVRKRHSRFKAQSFPRNWMPCSLLTDCLSELLARGFSCVIRPR